MSINWNDPAARLSLVERVGIAEYNRLHQEHIQASIVERCNGYAIRTVCTMFGRLFQVMETGQAFPSIDAARAFANSKPARS